MKRRMLWLWLAATLVASGGAGCPQMMRRYTAPIPPVLPPSPSIEQVIQAVNNNSSQIHSFSTNVATLKVPGAPTLRANLAMQRPRCFRLRAESLLMGPELDVGSNDERFWFWVRQSADPSVFYCRHDEFAGSRARQMIPVSPEWLIEAMGVVEFDPALPYQGPFVRPDGRLEIHTIVETMVGPSKKVAVIDQDYGWVLAQHLYDHQDRLIVSLTAEDHRRDPLSGLTMPRQVKIDCPQNNFHMEMNLGNVNINTLDCNQQQLWEVPQYPGSRLVNLGSPSSLAAVR